MHASRLRVGPYLHYVALTADALNAGMADAFKNIPLSLESDNYVYGRALAAIDDRTGQGPSTIYLYRRRGHNGQLIAINMAMVSANGGITAPAITVLGTFPARVDDAWELQVSSNGRYLALAVPTPSAGSPPPPSSIFGMFNSHSIRVYEMETDHSLKGLIGSYTASNRQIASLDFSPEGHYLYFTQTGNTPMPEGISFGPNLMRMPIPAMGTPQFVATNTTEVRRTFDGRMITIQGSSKVVTYDDPDNGSHATVAATAETIWTTGGLRPHMALQPLIIHNEQPLHTRSLGQKQYELTDHLGNVRAVVSDHKLAQYDPGTDEDPTDFRAELLSKADYEPFGALLPGRSAGMETQRFGFQGQEKDDEVFGAAGTSINYEFRSYDSRIARFISIDPLSAKYPMYSPYHFSSNQPIHAPELEGLESAWDLNSRDPNYQMMNSEQKAQFRQDAQAPAAYGIALGLGVGLDLAFTGGAASRFVGAMMVAQTFEHNKATSPQGQALQEQRANTNITNLALGYGASKTVGPLLSATRAPAIAPVQTPRGPAVQAMTPEAMSARASVQEGALIYRQGTFGVQNTADAQFWSLTNPATTPNYVQSLGMPGASTQGANWIMTGQVKTGVPFVTRPAPGIGTNAGGALEVVTPPGGVQVQTFTMP